MSNSTQYPTLAMVFPSGGESSGFILNAADRRRGYVELHSLLTTSATHAELAKAWQAKYEALVPKPVRKLREVTALWSDGSDSACRVRYNNGYQFVLDSGQVSGTYDTVADLVEARSGCKWPDEVLRQCLSLPNEPYEPVETVEEVLRDAMRACYLSGGATIAEMVSKYATRLRAAVLAETGGAE